MLCLLLMLLRSSTGHLVALDSEGETVMIPGDMMTHSISQAGSIDIDVNVRLLTTPGLTPADLGAPLTALDDLVRSVCICVSFFFALKIIHWLLYSTWILSWMLRSYSANVWPTLHYELSTNDWECNKLDKKHVKWIYKCYVQCSICPVKALSSWLEQI